MAFFGSSQMRRDLEEKVEPGIHKVGPPAIAVPAKKVPTYIPILIAVPLIALLYFIFDVHSWDGTTPMTCTAFDEVNIAGVEAQMRDGPMIVARGHCKLTCSDCVLTADRVIEVHEHATVRLSGGQIMGSSAAAVVTDYGQLINDQGTLSGPVSVMGHSIVQNFGVMTGPLFTAESGTALQLSAPPPDDD
jgi:hypothetical protein